MIQPTQDGRETRHQSVRKKNALQTVEKAEENSSLTFDFACIRIL